MLMFMRTRNQIKNDLVAIKKEISKLKSKELEVEHLVSDKEAASTVSSNMLTLFKIMLEESKTTRTMLRLLTEKLTRLEDDLSTDVEEEGVSGGEEPRTKEVAISDLDKKIMQFIQLKEMACAADVQKYMNYKGKNAASARLNKLYRQGVIERYQLGHKVFYKYNAGKTTNSILIVSPPQ